ncbi:MAG: sigma-70 family RNA polymerase sigma factor [Reyranella sp.]|uniref:sigma-70 family RNA polymerase sigma factor n=1 Tax=Reyranella sp. TaxID=1929291 RepID=UPI0012122A6D|nr:sigma-70 family RNA polymerase sigma factor [Reyranella sp.]TAJ39107.1 MAG: sigma-70 family RNA polymerase sigma factor [Reyranella sp.]
MAAPSLAVARPPFKDGLVALLPDLRAFSRFLCRERAAADDLVQNTAVIALSKQVQFEPGTNLKAWLFTIARSQFYSSLRSARRRTATVGWGDSENVAGVDRADRSSDLIDLSRALWCLNPEYREALMLVGACGFSYEEAAAVCTCGLGTMKARVSRARRRLAEVLADTGPSTLPARKHVAISAG